MQTFLDHPVAAISKWLEGSALSHLLQSVDWLVPLIQTVHILGVALVFSAVLMLLLGALGLSGREQTPERRQARFLPALRIGLPVLLATGFLMIAAEPDRALPNRVFQIKMCLLLLACTATVIGARRIAAAGATGATGRGWPAVAFVLWTAVLVAGRWIAYVPSH